MSLEDGVLESEELVVDACRTSWGKEQQRLWKHSERVREGNEYTQVEANWMEHAAVVVRLILLRYGTRYVAHIELARSCLDYNSFIQSSQQPAFTSPKKSSIIVAYVDDVLCTGEQRTKKFELKWTVISVVDEREKLCTSAASSGTQRKALRLWVTILQGTRRQYRRG